MWDDLLDTCIYAYNTSVHESTSFTHFEVMFGHKAILPIDVEMDIASPCINDEAEPLGSGIERLKEKVEELAIQQFQPAMQLKWLP